MKRDSSVVNGRTFLVTDLDGLETRAHDGLYHRDTRHLDVCRLRAATRGFESVAVTAPRPAEREVHLFDELSGGARSLRVSRGQIVSRGFYERIHVENLTGDPLTEKLEYTVGTGFDDLFEVRGFDADREREVAVTAGNDDHPRIRFRYDPAGLDATWVTTVNASAGTPAGGRGQGRADGVVEIPFELDPREATSVYVAIEPDVVEGDHEPTGSDPREAFEREAGAVAERASRWRQTAPSFADAPDGWEPVLEQSLENLLELRLDTEHGPVLAAGVPWFATAFGRDSIIAAYQSLGVSIEYAEGTCRYLAANQATDHDLSRAAEPGKIMHEIREGETTRRGETPHSPYYGTVDATALFVVLVHETWRRTGDDGFGTDLWPAVERALDWLGRRSAGGFLSYPADRTVDGLTHHAWKDSGDGISYPDGGKLDGPVAVAEVQGYHYDALVRGAELARDLADDSRRAATLEREATDLRRRFDREYWLPEEGFYAVALDDGEPVPCVASNPGHCLWSGIIPPERGDAVVDRLLADDMFSGWGIRTVSADHRVYNPQSYHLGSIWPHDTCLAALGMARYGRVDAARRVADGLVDAARARGCDRLPELFAGFDRRDTDVPIEYGEACEPQAWATATPLALLRIARENGRVGHHPCPVTND